MDYDEHQREPARTGPPPVLKIFVVEDDELFRRIICQALREWTPFQIIEASDGLEAIEKAKAWQPDLMLFDLGLPKLNGMESARQARRLVPHAKLLFMSQESGSEVVREAFRLGAHGYIHKQRAYIDLVPAIEAVLRGERFASSGLARPEGMG